LQHQNAQIREKVLFTFPLRISLHIETVQELRSGFVAQIVESPVRL
jgi:hypothetical protein